MATSNNNLAPSKNPRQSPQKTYLTFAQAAISKAATIVKQTISHLFLSFFLSFASFSLSLSLSQGPHTAQSHNGEAIRHIAIGPSSTSIRR
jgi:hypothetical protein